MTLTLILIATSLQDPAKPWTAEEAEARTRAALRDGSEPKDWRPGLKEHLNGFLDRVGKDGSADSLRFVFLSFEKAFDEGNAIRRDVPEKPEHSALLVPKATGKKAKEVLLLCESAEFEELELGVVVCLGDLKAKRLRKCLVVAAGKVRAEECEDCIVYAGGDLALTRRAKHCTLLVLGKTESPEAHDVVFLNPGERKIEKFEDCRDAEKPALPKKK